MRAKNFSRDRKTVLLYDELYNLKSLGKRRLNYNILHYKSNARAPFGFIAEYNGARSGISLPKIDFIQENQSEPAARILLKDIKEDFLKNVVAYTKSILFLDDLNRRHPISLGIWGTPPIVKQKALLFEYLRSRGIKVLGAQHGCVYGDSNQPWDFDSDFKRCDYYASYGFEESDLRNIYPDKEINTKILPVGMAESKMKTRKKITIDILFPITCSISMLQGEMTRIASHKLTERQLAILEFLNSLTGMNIYIKPFRNTDLDNLSVLSELKDMKNLKVVSNVHLEVFLYKFHPKAVVIELSSQPLFEVLGLDTEIFLMDNPMSPYGERALSELKRRVHYSEDTDEIIAKMDLFIKGKLERKRDETFYNHFVHKGKTEDNVLKLIDTLIEEREVCRV